LRTVYRVCKTIVENDQLSKVISRRGGGPFGRPVWSHREELGNFRHFKGADHDFLVTERNVPSAGQTRFSLTAVQNCELTQTTGGKGQILLNAAASTTTQAQVRENVPERALSAEELCDLFVLISSEPEANEELLELAVILNDDDLDEFAVLLELAGLLNDDVLDEFGDLHDDRLTASGEVEDAESPRRVAKRRMVDVEEGQAENEAGRATRDLDECSMTTGDTVTVSVHGVVGSNLLIQQRALCANSDGNFRESFALSRRVSVGDRSQLCAAVGHRHGCENRSGYAGNPKRAKQMQRIGASGTASGST